MNIIKDRAAKTTALDSRLHDHRKKEWANNVWKTEVKPPKEVCKHWFDTYNTAYTWPAQRDFNLGEAFTVPGAHWRYLEEDKIIMYIPSAGMIRPYCREEDLNAERWRAPMSRMGWENHSGQPAVSLLDSLLQGCHAGINLAYDLGERLLGNIIELREVVEDKHNTLNKTVSDLQAKVNDLDKEVKRLGEVHCTLSASVNKKESDLKSHISLTLQQNNTAITAEVVKALNKERNAQPEQAEESR